MIGREKIKRTMDNGEFVKQRVMYGDCPRHFGLKDAKQCDYTPCDECWNQALEAEVEE